MADVSTELNERFSAPNEALSTEVMTELQSIIRIHSLPVEELSYKWESYCMKMGAETKLTLNTARDFKKDLQEALERETRSKAARSLEKRSIAATPRPTAVGVDTFEMLDGLVSNTPRPSIVSTMKRKSKFETPASKAAKSDIASSPASAKTPGTVRAFVDRERAGEIEESLNGEIGHPELPTLAPTEPRIKPKANTDIIRFSYKTMAMKLSEASEILDERIVDFTELVQKHHNLEDGDLGDPTRSSQTEIVAVGRITSDSQDGKLNAASLLLETTRARGGAVRVPLKVDNLSSFDFFPGKIVALRGTNASGDFFSVTEVLEMPPMIPQGYSAEEMDVYNERLQDASGNERPLTILMASGPYTTEEELDYAPFRELLSKAEELRADALILNGPFLDVEHPAVRHGDFDLPPDFHVDPDKATLNDAFRCFISSPLQRLVKALPSITIILVPSLRDAISKHTAWPQDRIAKQGLNLSKQISIVTNPVTMSFNEVMVGTTSLDVLDQLRATGIARGKANMEDYMARLCKNVLEQRHFFPVFPPVDRQVLEQLGEQEGATTEAVKSIGASLDLSYYKLAEMISGLPDILMLPSVLKPFAKVVQNAIVINPGTLSKKRGAGTYARLTIKPRVITAAERESGQNLAHQLYQRTRVDIVRI